MPQGGGSFSNEQSIQLKPGTSARFLNGSEMWMSSESMVHVNISMYDADTLAFHTALSFLAVSAHWAIVIVLPVPPRAPKPVQRAWDKKIQLRTYMQASTTERSDHITLYWDLSATLGTEQDDC